MTDSSPSWLFHQSAVVPYRTANGVLQVALITSSGGKRWVLPKGVIDPGETAASSAEREALEEAGLLGTLSRHPIGQYIYEKWGGTCRVEVYLMAVTEARQTWPESDLRTRRWLSVEAAARRVDEPELKKMIRSVPDHLAAGP